MDLFGDLLILDISENKKSYAPLCNQWQHIATLFLCLTYYHVISETFVHELLIYV